MKYKILIIVLISLTLVLLGASFALYGRTLSSLIPLIVISVVAAVATWFISGVFWRRFADGLKPVYRVLLHVVTMTSVVLFSILALNYFGADENAEKEHEAVVVRRYFKERETSNRVGRRHYSTPGRKYKVYYMTLRFDDGREKDVQITLNKYNRLKTGTKYSIDVYDGLLGMPVVKAFP